MEGKLSGHHTKTEQLEDGVGAVLRARQKVDVCLYSTCMQIAELVGFYEN